MVRLPLAFWWWFWVMGLLLIGLATASPTAPVDWPHWRGPQQNGVSHEQQLPESWSPNGENLLWRKEQYATRSTPIVMSGRLYTICRAYPETTREGEKVVCLNAETGELIWESVNNVFLSDAPAERVGWSSVVADIETGNLYSLGLGCFFQCLDAQSGERRWSRSMSEEYGMLSTYGGRTNTPIVFEDLVIISGVTTGWGEDAPPAHRFYAFDKRTGDVVWVASTGLRPEDTTYSTPIVTTFNGQAAIVVGAGDGSVYALQPRTGRMIWKYGASNRGINTTALVSGGIVYCGHSEQNRADTTVLGALFAIDGRGRGEIGESQLLWKIPARTVGRCQPLLVDDRLYAVDDGGTLWIVDAKTGQELGRRKLGRIMFGSMVYGDGKIYVGEATGRWYVLRPSPSGVEVVHQLRLNNEEIHGSPIISHGRIYLPTSAALYCIGRPQPASPLSPVATVNRSIGQEMRADRDAAIAHLQIVPAETLLEPGGEQPFSIRAYDANGQIVGQVSHQPTADGSSREQHRSSLAWTVQGAGTVDSTGYYVASGARAHSAALVTAKLGELTATARVRIIPPLPWTFDFADGEVPVTWVGATYRHQAREVDGESLLVKVSTIPKGTRSQAWMGPTHLRDYTVEADFVSHERNGKTAEMGLINQRYTLVMNGSGELQIRSWTSRLELRFAKTIPFHWQPDKWYTMKFQSENDQDRAVLRGKVWPRGSKEPATWDIEAADTAPNTLGSPGMFGNASDAEFYIDNIKVYANPEKEPSS